jgi:hypothetical protein
MLTRKESLELFKDWRRFQAKQLCPCASDLPPESGIVEVVTAIRLAVIVPGGLCVLDVAESKHGVPQGVGRIIALSRNRSKMKSMFIASPCR